MSILLSLIVLLEAKSRKVRSARVGARQKKGLTQVTLPIVFPSDDRADGELDLCFIRRSRARLFLTLGVVCFRHGVIPVCAVHVGAWRALARLALLVYLFLRLLVPAQFHTAQSRSVFTRKPWIDLLDSTSLFSTSTFGVMPCQSISFGQQSMTRTLEMNPNPSPVRHSKRILIINHVLVHARGEKLPLDQFHKSVDALGGLLLRFSCVFL